MTKPTPGADLLAARQKIGRNDWLGLQGHGWASLVAAYHDPAFDREHNTLDARLERFLQNCYGQGHEPRAWWPDNPWPKKFPDADVRVAALQARWESLNRDLFTEKDRQAASVVFGKDGTPVTIKDGAWATRLTEAEYRESRRRERELSTEFARVSEALSQAKGVANDLRRAAQDWQVIEEAKRELAEQEARLTPAQRAARERYQADQERTVTDRQALR